MRARAVICALTLVLAARALPAQGSGRTASVLPAEVLELFPRDRLAVEVNLEGPLLRLVAAATREEDPEFAELVSGLQAIRVRIAHLEASDAEGARNKLRGAADLLERRAWQPVVRITDEGDDVYIYLAERDGEIAGLTVLFLDAPEQAGYVEIIGRIDPQQLGKIGSHFDLPQLEKIPLGPPGKGAPKGDGDAGKKPGGGRR